MNPYGDGKDISDADVHTDHTDYSTTQGLLKKKAGKFRRHGMRCGNFGDKAQAEGIALFTYPTNGYFRCILLCTASQLMGEENFTKALKYEEGIWDTPEAQQVFDIIAKLASYTEKTTPANANDNDFQKISR